MGYDSTERKVIYMKKMIVCLITICLLITVFAACSKPNDVQEDTSNDVVSTSTITTDEAVITDSQAIDYIKSYSAEELSLSDEDYENCSFLVNSSGIEIDGNYYVEVIAAIKNSHTDEDGKESFTFDNKGEYFIRYDGQQILKRNMNSEDIQYDEMEIKDIPETTVASSEAEETTAD